MNVPSFAAGLNDKAHHGISLKNVLLNDPKEKTQFPNNVCNIQNEFVSGSIFHRTTFNNKICIFKDPVNSKIIYIICLQSN